MKKYQRGMSTLGWAVVVGGIIAVATVAVKMVPVYTENMYIVDAMESLVENEGDLKALDKSTIRTRLQKYMVINAVSTEASKGISIERYQRRLLVTSDYEVRVPIAFNIDVVMSFRNQLDTDNPDLCCDYLIEIPDEKN